MKMRCFLRKKSGFENLAAAKSIVDEATMTRPIRIRLVTQAINKESSPLLSKEFNSFLILLASIIHYYVFKMTSSMLIVIIHVIARRAR